jgi:transcriptional regulator with XRE-family HTH domain
MCILTELILKNDDSVITNIKIQVNNIILNCMKTLGERLKYIRKSRDLTQTELAIALHLSRNQISSYENDQVQPSIDVIISYCEFFNITSDSILNISDSDAINLEEQLVKQIIQSSRRMTSEQRRQFLKQITLFAKFLERHKEGLI